MEDYKVLRSYGFRKDRLLSQMTARNLDCLLLTSPENVFYVTGYTVLPSSGNPILHTLRNRLPYAVHIDSQGAVSLVCWGFSVEGVSFGVDEIVRINTFRESIEALLRLLSTRQDKKLRVGIESTMPYAIFSAIQSAYPAIDLVDSDEVMAELRLIKSSSEIEQITQSTRKIEQTVQELYGVLSVGMSRLELIQEAKYRLLKNGADGISHATFAFGRDNPEIALDEKLEKNNLITLDLGGIFNGYSSDTRRYAFTGKVPSSVLAKYETMVQIVDGVGAALVPGATYAQVSRRGIELFEKHGEKSAGRLTHVGHNIGIETEEEWIDETEKQIRVGMVINIELYTTTDTFGHVGNEETFVIEQSGPRKISTLPRKIKAIGLT